jgi:hypothetical protein
MNDDEKEHNALVLRFPRIEFGFSPKHEWCDRSILDK